MSKISGAPPTHEDRSEIAGYDAPEIASFLRSGMPDGVENMVILCSVALLNAGRSEQFPTAAVVSGAVALHQVRKRTEKIVGSVEPRYELAIFMAEAPWLGRSQAARLLPEVRTRPAIIGLHPAEVRSGCGP